jgi:hypothetical protein
MSKRKLPSDLKGQFIDLACQLSPENLHCDGEISPAQAKKKRDSLWKEWRRLEQIAARSVEESELFQT